MRYDRLYFSLRHLQPGTLNAYLLATVLVAAATAVRLWLATALPGVQFITMFPAVLATALFCGMAAGFFAVITASVCAWFFILPPQYSFSLKTIEQVYVLLFFVAVASVIVFAIGAMRRSVEQVQSLNQTLLSLNRSLTSVFEASPDAILLVDQGGRITGLNHRTAELFGRPKDGLIGAPMTDLLPERFRARHARHYAGYMADPRPRSMGAGLDLSALHGDGSEFPVDIQIGPLEVHGEVQAIATVRDVREYRALHQALAESQKQQAVLQERQRAADEIRLWADAFKHAAIGLAIVEPKSGTFLATNPAYARACGMSTEEIQGRPVVDTFLEDERPRLAELIAEADRLGHMHCERRHTRKDGSTFPVEVEVASIRAADGAVIYRVASLRDITERYEIEQEKEQQRQELARSEADLQSFAYIISHDLKAPLRGIAHLAEWIGEDIASTASAETIGHVALLLGRVARLQALLQGLWSYSRLGQDRSEAEDVDIAELVGDILAATPPPPGFMVSCMPAVPRIRTHRVPLRVVLDNLISNAIKHHDRADGRITVTAGQADGVTEFRVSDDGPGILPQFHDRIFEIFQTLASRDVVEASGIGLAIVKKMVVGHGGRIWVESAPPVRGSTFGFTWR